MVLSEWDIGLPTQLSNRRRDGTWLEKFLWLHMSLKSLDSRLGHAVPCDGFSMSRNHSLKIITSGFLFRIFPEIHSTESCTRTPKYSCRDCWTGVNPMKNDQQNPNDNILFGLQKRTPSNKPKEKRILETVNRVITRIQNDERNYLWPNIPTRPV